MISTGCDYFDSISLLPGAISFLKKQHALIVGHSNTILEIATVFGVHPTISIGDNDFDNLLIVKRAMEFLGTLCT
jgi:hypothetical protein